MDKDIKLSRQLAPLWPYARRRLAWLLGLAGMIIVGVISNLLVSRGLGAAVDAGLEGSWEGFQRAALVIVVSWLSSDLALFGRTALAGRIAEWVCYQLRQDAVGRLSRAQVSQLRGTHSGDYASRLSNDLTLVRGLFAAELPMFLRAPLQCVVSLIFMLLVSWKVTLISVAVIPLLMLLSNRISRPIAEQSREAQAEMAGVTALSQDAVNGVLVTKAFNLGAVLATRYRQAGSRQAEAAVRLAGSQARLHAASYFFNLAPTLILFGFGGYEVVMGRMTLGNILVLLNLIGNLSWPLQALTQSYGRVKQAVPAVERIAAISQLPAERSGGDGLATAAATGALLELDDVSFAYGPDRSVFRGLRLTVSPGETVAIVGPSGVGKSTLLALLLGLLEPTAGQLRLHGLPVEQLSLAQLRRCFTYVPQDPQLFNRTIRENIQLGRPDASDAAIEQAAKQAFADEFIRQLPLGYDTQLGEEGQGLSGGQKQRIAIARAVLKQAPILLLDEATSALDMESEARVQAAIESLRGSRTLLIVAHRLSTIRSADRIVVLQDGAAAEEGTHEQLLAAGGVYAALYHSQFSAQERVLAATGTEEG